MSARRIWLLCRVAYELGIRVAIGLRVLYRGGGERVERPQAATEGTCQARGGVLKMSDPVCEGPGEEGIQIGAVRPLRGGTIGSAGSPLCSKPREVPHGSPTMNVLRLLAPSPRHSSPSLAVLGLHTPHNSFSCEVRRVYTSPLESRRLSSVGYWTMALRFVYYHCQYRMCARHAYSYFLTVCNLYLIYSLCTFRCQTIA